MPKSPRAGVRKLRILFVLENYLPHIGGVETVFKHLCEGMAARGHQVRVVTRQLPGTSREEVIAGVRVVRVPCMDSRYLFTFLAVPSVVRYAKDADLIHTTTFNGAPPAWLGARLRGKPVIITVHETWIGKWREYTNFSAPRAWLHDLLERAVFLPRFDRYACVSNSTARQLAAALPGRKGMITAVYNGFDPSPWQRKHDTRALRKRLGLGARFVVLGFGRPGTSKGFEHLVRAFPAIKRRIPTATLLLILSASQQYAAELERLKSMAGDELGKGVRFLPSQRFDDLIAHVQMADCVVVPSLTEGFGYAVLETASTGTPVVASDTTSIPEVVCGRHVLVPPKDPDAIARGVAQVAAGKEKKIALKRFPWTATLDAYAREYRQLLRRHRP